jgi:hypothetical protein
MLLTECGLVQLSQFESCTTLNSTIKTLGKFLSRVGKRKNIY